MLTSYVRLDAPGVRYVGACAGPAHFAVVERAGVTLSVTLEPGISSRSKEGLLIVMGPLGTQVSIPHPEGRVTRSDAGEPRVMDFQLRQVPAEGPYDDEMARRGGRVRYRYRFFGLPDITFPGELTLPEIQVNGTMVALPAFKFERRPYAGISPLNC